MISYSRDKFIEHVLPRFFNQAKDIQCVENNYSTLLYHHLILHGYSHRQICREMLTKFDSGNKADDTRRPDLSIFSQEINGRFNYTHQGTQSNTELKRKSLKCLIEFKGSAWRSDSQALSDTSPKGELMKDIQVNLPRWRRLLNPNSDYFFFGVNLIMPKGIWNLSKIEQVANECHNNKVHFVYYMQGTESFRVMEWDKNPKSTPYGKATREIKLISS